MKKMIFATALLLSTLGQASLLTFEQGTMQLENVNLNKSAAINDQKGQPTTLKMDLLGAGLRSKTVLFVAAKVYIAQLFSDNKAAFSRDANALKSLVDNSKSVALKISMLRTVSASSLSVSFKEALTANGYAIDSDLSAMLAIVEKGADGIQGKDLTMMMIKGTDGKISVYYEDAKGATQSFVGQADVMTKIMSIWLGTPADGGLKTLKENLIKPVY
jgi:Chalcone isomerase-like